MLFEEIEKQSLKENKWLPYPNIPYVMIHGKDYICTIHLGEEPMNRGSCRQHVEGKAHKTNFDTGEPINTSKNYPPLPSNAQKNLIHAKEQKLQKFEEKEVDEKENISNSNPTQFPFERRVDFTRYLVRDKTFSSLDPPKPQPQQVKEPLDEWDRKILAWKKAQSAKAMGMPQEIIDKFLIKKGLKKVEKPHQLTEDDIMEFAKILKLLRSVEPKNST